MAMSLEPLATASRQVQEIKPTAINMDAETAKELIDFFYDKINQSRRSQDVANVPDATSMVITKNNDLHLCVTQR